MRHGLQVLDHILHAVVKRGLGVLQAVLLAERNNDFVRAGEAVPRHHREEVVIHLVLKAAAQPVHEGATADVARRRDLQRPVVRPRRGFVRRHAVVPVASHDENEQASDCLRQEPEPHRGEQRGALVAQHRDPRMVDDEEALLQEPLHPFEPCELHAREAVAREVVAEHASSKLDSPAVGRERERGGGGGGVSEVADRERERAATLTVGRGRGRRTQTRCSTAATRGARSRGAAGTCTAAFESTTAPRGHPSRALPSASTTQAAASCRHQGRR